MKVPKNLSILALSTLVLSRIRFEGLNKVLSANAPPAHIYHISLLIFLQDNNFFKIYQLTMEFFQDIAYN